MVPWVVVVPVSSAFTYGTLVIFTALLPLLEPKTEFTGTGAGAGQGGSGGVAVRNGAEIGRAAIEQAGNAARTVTAVAVHGNVAGVVAVRHVAHGVWEKIMWEFRPLLISLQKMREKPS